MELYATHSLQILATGNWKQREMQEYIYPFDRMLIDGKLGLDAMVADLKAKAAELNAKYPRQKEISVRLYDDSVVYVSTDYDCDFCRLHITKLCRTYRFSENLPATKILMEGD
ncbi:MAG: hypothetical protein LBN27_12155 [Prevotellaceae bacterium]|jgi:hypothetical protein|nr:hypothetical protein [Prevotellaceae bacterium]